MARKISAQLAARTVDGSAWMREQLESNPALAAAVEEEQEKFEIAETIYEARIEAGLTQAQLAELVGTSQPAIARLESTDYGRFSHTTLRKIAKALNLKLKVTLTKEKQPRKSSPRKRAVVSV